jgi:cold shock CspA family protein
MRGVVMSIRENGRFGFIRGQDGRDYFFHATALKGVDFEEISRGSHVMFEVKERAPGDLPDEHPRAVDVTLVPEEVPAVDNEPLPPEKVLGAEARRVRKRHVHVPPLAEST